MSVQMDGGAALTGIPELLGWATDAVKQLRFGGKLDVTLS